MFQYSPNLTFRFNFQQALYRFKFQGFDGSYFNKYISGIFTNVIPPLVKTAISKPLYYNLLTWMAYTNYYYIGKGAEQTKTTFQFTGTASRIFRRDDTFGAMGSAKGSCPAESLSYDRIYAGYSMGWTLANSKFVGASEGCNNVLKPKKYGYRSQYGDEFALNIDLVALTTAAAVNLKITTTDSLEATGIPKKDGLSSFVRNKKMKHFYILLH